MIAQGFRFARPRRLLAAVVLALAAVAATGGTASAATTCEYEPAAEVLTVQMSAASDSAHFNSVAGTILVAGSSGAVACTGGTPTLANTEAVNIFGPGEGDFVEIDDPNSFANQTKFIYAVNGAQGSLYLPFVANTAHNIVVGAAGVDSDGDGDADISFFTTPANVGIESSSMADTITAQGGPGVGGPLTAPIVIRGQGGNDHLIGGDGPDDLLGGEGADTLEGMGGNDTLMGDRGGETGEDVLDGGAGRDGLRFETKGIRVDLADTKPQNTGEGIDTILGVEDVEGTEGADVLLGNASANRLVGESGNDVIDGRGGDDELQGLAGVDTVLYDDAPAAVNVDLGKGTASGGFGNDQLANFENVVGSAFGDRLLGSEAANRIEPGAGADIVQALGGDDTILARDGVGDDLSCGAGTDSATTDRRSLDNVHADCEQVDALPEPAVPGGGGTSNGSGSGAGAGGGPAKLLLRIGGAAKQRLVAHHALVVKVRCPQEACEVTAKAGGRLPAVGSEPAAKVKLKAVKKRLAAGKSKKLSLKVGAKQAAAIAARLRAGKHVALKVSVTATDAAGALAVGSLRVTATG